MLESGVFNCSYAQSAVGKKKFLSYGVLPASRPSNCPGVSHAEM